MRPAATLAHAAGSLETHAPAELAPMSRIQVAEVSMDRHASRDLAQWGSKWPQILYQNLNWGFPGQPPQGPFVHFDESHHHRNHPGRQHRAGDLLGSPTCRRNSGATLPAFFGSPARVPVAMTVGCLYSGSGLWAGDGGAGHDCAIRDRSWWTGDDGVSRWTVRLPFRAR